MIAFLVLYFQRRKKFHKLAFVPDSSVKGTMVDDMAPERAFISKRGELSSSFPFLHGLGMVTAAVCLPSKHGRLLADLQVVWLVALTRQRSGGTSG